MAKIFYTIDTQSVLFVVLWIDENGRQHKDHPVQTKNLSDMHAEFKKEHPGAQEMSWGGFNRRLRDIEHERVRIAAWNRGLPL